MSDSNGIADLGALAFVLGGTAVAIQLFYAYVLQVIADKQDQPGIVRFLAWIPPFNVYCFVRCGGGRFGRLLLGCVGGALLAGAAFAGGKMAGNEIVAGAVLTLVAAAGVLLLAVYGALLCFRMAERRDLSGWMGLLCLVPIVNLFAFPYIAFHDGATRPAWAGLIVGLLLTAGPVAGHIQIMQMLESQGATALLRAHLDGDRAQVEVETGRLPAALGGEGGELSEALETMGSMVEVGAQMARLGELDPSDPEQAAELRSAVQQMRAELEARGAGLDPEVREDLLRTLSELETAAAPAAPAAKVTLAATQTAATGRGVVTRVSSTGPAAVAPSSQTGDAGVPIAGSVDGRGCPAGTAPQGASPPQGLERWCARIGANAGQRHGWYTKWHENGHRETTGEYRDGLQTGVWTRFYTDGSPRARAQFVAGLQNGKMSAWDPEGRLVRELEFRDGKIVR